MSERVYTPRQVELRLPAQSTDEILADRLAEAAELFNASDDPVERCELHEEILRFRRAFYRKGAPARG